MRMLLAIRHYPDRKKPCIVLEEEDKCQALVLGYLTDIKRERWLRKAIMGNTTGELSIPIYSPYNIDKIVESENIKKKRKEE